MRFLFQDLYCEHGKKHKADDRNKGIECEAGAQIGLLALSLCIDGVDEGRRQTEEQEGSVTVDGIFREQDAGQEENDDAEYSDDENTAEDRAQGLAPVNSGEVNAVPHNEKDQCTGRCVGKIQSRIQNRAESGIADQRAESGDADKNAGKHDDVDRCDHTLCYVTGSRCGSFISQFQKGREKGEENERIAEIEKGDVIQIVLTEEQNKEGISQHTTLKSSREVGKKRLVHTCSALQKLACKIGGHCHDCHYDHKKQNMPGKGGCIEGLKHDGGNTEVHEQTFDRPDAFVRQDPKLSKHDACRKCEQDRKNNGNNLNCMIHFITPHI